MTPNQIAEKIRAALGNGLRCDPVDANGKSVIEMCITEALEEKEDMLAYHKAEEEHAKEQLTASQERERKLREALDDVSTHLDPLLAALLRCRGLEIDMESKAYWDHELQAHHKYTELITEALSLTRKG